MIWGLHTASRAPDSLGQAFSNLLPEVPPCRGVSLRIFILGSARALNPAIQEQLFLIGREAVMNALRHSTATKIEVEVQYLHDFLCLFVRDNGSGINLDEIQQARNSLWGLRGMRDRAENIGAQFGIWSRPGAGTEVRVAVPVDVAVAPA
jgi:signal transduction histidine kinase